MTRAERRQLMDQVEVEKIRSRLARIKVAITRKRVERLQANVLEAVLLRARMEGGEDRGHAQQRR